MTVVMTAVMNLNRALPREALRAKIYAAAIAAFRAHGYDGTSVEAIAARAGIAKGTFFNFYKSKLDVLMEYYWEVDARLLPLRAGLDPKQPVAALSRYAQAAEQELRREGDLLIDLLEQTMRDATLRRTDYASGEADARQFADFLRRARALGTVRRTLDATRGSALVIDVWAGAMRTWLAGDCKASLAKIFKTRIVDLFRGFAPRGRKA